MKNPNKCRYIMFGLIIVGLIVAGTSETIFDSDFEHVFFVLGAVLAFGSIIFGILMVRCPFCHRHLHLKGITPDEFCPYCGKKLE